MFYPLERDNKARAAWLKAFKMLDINKLVFLDETSSYLNVSRNYGWARTSARVIDQEPKGKKERVSLIAAIGLNHGLAEVALVHPDSVNKNAFKAYLNHVLLPKLEPDTTLVMDNWTVHHGADIKELVEAHNCQILYLPTYSPDFNPIEFLFSKVKAFVKKLRPKSKDDLIHAFMDATKTVSLEDITHTFRHCKYLVQ